MITIQSNWAVCCWCACLLVSWPGIAWLKAGVHCQMHELSLTYQHSCLSSCHLSLICDWSHSWGLEDPDVEHREVIWDVLGSWAKPLSIHIGSLAIRRRSFGWRGAFITLSTCMELQVHTKLPVPIFRRCQEIKHFWGALNNHCASQWWIWHWLRSYLGHNT